MTAPDDSSRIPIPDAGSSRRRLWFALKWLLLAAVLAFVGRRAWQLWQQDQGALAEIAIEPGWLVLAGAMYAVGWAPSVWFWRALMHRLGGSVGYRDAARAYYCGHLGKYVPGKAAVLVIRSAMVKGRGTGAAAAAVTAMVETLLMMGAGLAVALALAPLLLTGAMMSEWPDWTRRLVTFPGLSALLTVAAIVAALPLLSRLLTSIAVRMTPRALLEGPQTVEITPRLVATGLGAFVASWAIHGLSLGLTLRAVSGGPLNLADWPMWTGSAAAATVLGFAALVAPGGIGVREGVLIELLRVQPDVGAQQAVATAILLRVVWFATEFVSAALLYYALAPREMPNDST